MAAAEDAVMTEQNDLADTVSSTSAEELPSNRFELELEFVQCLASPAYLHHLATTGVLTEPSFLEFLEYLQYWRKPEYSKLISYPHCLFFLDQLINNPVFRRELANVSFRNFIHEQQFYSWQYRARNLYGQGLPAEEKGEMPSEKQEPTSEQQEEAQTQK